MPTKEDRSIVSLSEAWTEVTLDDGATLKMKVVPIRIERIVGKVDQDGKPEYAVMHAVVVAVKSSMAKPN